MLYATHRTIEGIKNMRWGFGFAVVFAGCLAAASQNYAQTPAPADAQGQAKPATAPQKPAATQPQAPAPTPSNAFPEDTSNIPVVSAKSMAEGNAGTEEGMHLAAPSADFDPVRSPDDAAAADELQGDSSSSSSAGMDKLLPASGDDVPNKHRRLAVEEPAHQAGAPEDISVGDYYLQTKNWRAALSRFESAMVLAPENPEVFWGLAESQRHLGNFAEARKNYQTVVDYDPDGKHGKDARKALKDPEIANARPPAVGQPLAGSSQK
jgi:tetratricopeptide (TPR) repeat protein